MKKTLSIVAVLIGLLAVAAPAADAFTVTAPTMPSFSTYRYTSPSYSRPSYTLPTSLRRYSVARYTPSYGYRRSGQYLVRGYLRGGRYISPYLRHYPRRSW